MTSRPPMRLSVPRLAFGVDNLQTPGAGGTILGQAQPNSPVGGGTLDARRSTLDWVGGGR
jgi:hypothetical protein